MRLKTATVRNYRIHRELTVKFDQSHTLIGGPNESGKSTLAEAIHRALFLKARTAADVQRCMVSTRFSGQPEVELTFSVNGRDYHLLKRFSGSNGTARLSEIGGATWHGDEAESRLAALLNSEPIAVGQVRQQWSHLWIWQGQSGNDPSEQANLHKEDLLQRLQEMGGAAVLQSNLDAEVAARFAAARDEMFTQAGKAKAGTELALAQNELEQAGANHQSALERVEKLRIAVQDVEQAAREISEARTALENLKPKKQAVEARIAQRTKLRHQEELQSGHAKQKNERYEDLKKADQNITKLREKIEKLTAAHAPVQAEEEKLDAWLKTATERVDEAEKALNTARDAVTAARLRRDLAASWVDRFEKQARLEELQGKQNQVNGINARLAELRQELGKLPEINNAKLKRLQKLEGQVNEAEAALKAMAAGIEILTASEPVQVGQRAIEPGESLTVTELTEISVGTLLRLRIHPGGGASLLEAREQLREARDDLNETLGKLGIDSVTRAIEVLARRDHLSAEIGKEEGALEALDAASLPARLAETAGAAAAAADDVTANSMHLPESTPPQNLTEAKEQRTAASQHLDEIESTETGARHARDKAVKTRAEAEGDLEAHRADAKNQRDELTKVNAELEVSLKQYGEDGPRAMALTEALDAKNEAQALLNTTKTDLAALQPELLDNDHNRLANACEKQRNAKHDAEHRLTAARALLRHDGTENPEEDLALAASRLRTAQDHLAHINRKSAAVRLLDQLFEEEQRALSERFTAPFADKISGYLRCLFGHGAAAAITLDEESSFTGLRLIRPTESAAVPFDSLSGGAREQVAAAVRLAMAEVLAANHGDCLPVVFDDAFAYSDPERVQTLQRMLDLAGSRGLQLIILTCNPADYAALGAPVVRLRESIASALDGQSVPAETEQAITVREWESDEVTIAASPQTPHIAVLTVTDAQRNRLVEELRQRGAKAGNQALRAALGWDEQTYTAVRTDLVTAGRLTLGKGRGGSVALTGI
jgi:DNA repair exonuclease SbcCD ATPase subunit